MTSFVTVPMTLMRDRQVKWMVAKRAECGRLCAGHRPSNPYGFASRHEEVEIRKRDVVIECRVIQYCSVERKTRALASRPMSVSPVKKFDKN